MHVWWCEVRVSHYHHLRVWSTRRRDRRCGCRRLGRRALGGPIRANVAWRLLPVAAGAAHVGNFQSVDFVQLGRGERPVAAVGKAVVCHHARICEDKGNGAVRQRKRARGATRIE
jgi:hypothetical protein